MKPLVLCILDGVGIREEKFGNALKEANTPNFDNLWNNYPHSLLEASGKAVGLPDGQMGNSEVGHTNIGAGRLVYQPLELINSKIEDKSFYINENILKVINHAKENNSKLHILGLLSDGGIHSHINHLFALIDMCKRENVDNLYIHAFLDGRDTLPSVALKYLDMLDNKLKETGIGKIATLSGRYYAMDRDNNWERIKKAYDAIVLNKGERYSNYKEAIEHNYNNKIEDEFIIPCILNEEGMIDDNDGLILFNFRPDRARELFKVLTNPSDEFEVKNVNNLKLVTMMPVSDEVKCINAFDNQKLDNTLGEYISNLGLKQLRIAETEKYAHVTYFFDGGIEKDLPGCDRVLIPSPKVATYDLKPEMSAYEITDRLLNELDKNIYDIVILNYANGDMVGHTGVMEAAVASVEVLDECLGKLYNKVTDLGGTLVVTADHGNCDYMIDGKGNIITSHSTSKVPFIVTNKSIKLNDGKLGDIAPTILRLLNLEIPEEMNGVSLIKKKRKLNKKNIFIFISFILIILMFSIYTYRFIHYYNLENGKKEIVIDNSLAGKVIENNEIVSNDGLYYSSGDYIFKGNVDNNYVYYSGMLFRIVKINSDKTMKLVTDDIVNAMVFDDEADYENSYIRSWLNNQNKDYTGIFYNNLSNPEKYIIDTEFCIDKVDKDDTNKCKEKIKDKVGLLTYQEYLDAGNYKSYLNINKYWWLINATTDNKIWYVYDKGGINNNSKDESTYYSYGVRPVITLNSNINFISGDGTSSNPYIIEEENSIKTGSYIKYNDYVWRVVSKSDSEIKVVMNDYIKVNDKYVEKSYSKTDSSFNSKNYYNIAYYLNNTFYNTLKNKDLIVNGTWYNGKYNIDNAYNYTKIYEDSIQAKVGLLNISDMFVTDLVSSTMTPSTDDMIYVTTELGNLYLDQVTTELQVRPALYLTANLNIYSGSGKLEDPYIIEE